MWVPQAGRVTDGHENVHTGLNPGSFPVDHPSTPQLPLGDFRRRIHGPSGMGEPKHPQMPSLLASDFSRPPRLRSGGPRVPFPTSVPPVTFALGPAPAPGNILLFPELRPLPQLPSLMGILTKCFLSQDHLISSSSPMAGIQEPKAALCSLLILNLLSSISRSRERPGGDGQRSR